MPGWTFIAHWMGWDSVSDNQYAFWSGGGGLVVVWVASLLLVWWRSSCHERRRCLRHGRHEVTDPETGTVHRVCWKHAGLPAKYGARIREIQAKHKLLYLGNRPGKG